MRHRWPPPFSVVGRLKNTMPVHGCEPGACSLTVPGSHHPQFIDAVHRDHATVETDGVRTAKAMGLRNLPSKSWQVNAGWVIAANIAADLTAWTRLLGHHNDEEPRNAEPDTLRYRAWHLPA
jgi:hypothetical protein